MTWRWALLGATTLRLVAAEAPDLRLRITELERLISEHQHNVAQHELQLSQLRHADGLAERRLAVDVSLPPSIFGASNSTRSYTESEEIASLMDQMWLILCGCLVMFMQAGFALVESGSCRSRNVQNILLKNLTDVCMGTLGWWCSGWALAYSGPMKDGLLENGFAGYSSWFGAGFLEHRPGVGFEPTTSMANWFFQWTFCSAAATIVSGGVAERVNFAGYCLFSLFMTMFVYPVIVAWTWGYGFLATVTRTGFMDFAGSGIVHMTGGVAALVGASVAGPRRGRWEEPEEAFQPHSLPLIVLGTMVLWFGWYGFNCGSTLGMSQDCDDAAVCGTRKASIERGFMAAQVAMNTTIAAAVGGITVFLCRLGTSKKYDIAGFCNGILAGLVSITAGCGNVECGSSFMIAVVGGIVYEVSSRLVKKMKVDDPIDAFAVHGAPGMWGTLAAAIFDWGRSMDQFHGWSGFSCVAGEDGECLQGAGADGIGANVLQIVLVSLWTIVWSLIIFLPLRFSGKLTVSDEIQLQGMDSAKHTPSGAYAMNMATPEIYTSEVTPIEKVEHLQ